MKPLPIFPILNATPSVTTLLKSDGILRVFEFGMATENPKMPYVVWQVAAGTPYNNFSCGAQADKILVQFDVYATTGSQSKQILALLREVLEPHCYIVDLRGTDRDSDGVYRSSFDASWHVTL